jgi:hypothetical protein
MTGKARTIRVNLPGYQRDRYGWRRQILEAALRAKVDAGVSYAEEERFEVVVLLYLAPGKRHHIHDVDNRLKDILDALQGRFGPERATTRLIEDDRYISRAVIEKQPIPKSQPDDAGGKLLIRPYEPRRWPLQRVKGDRTRKSAAKVRR